MACKKEINMTKIFIGCPSSDYKILMLTADGLDINRLPFNQLKACMLTPLDIDLVVGGSNPLSPVVNSTTWQVPAFAGWRVRLTLDRVPQTICPEAPDGSYYDKPIDQDTLALFGGLVFKSGMIIHLEFWLASDDVAPRYIVEEDGATQIGLEDGTSIIE